MKFEVNITEEDYLKFNYYHHFHSKAGKKLIFGMRIAKLEVDKKDASKLRQRYNDNRDLIAKLRENIILSRC